ncbi:MAG: transporter substrate-binding domain-containing protein [Pseudomonadota bacterium]
MERRQRSRRCFLGAALAGACALPAWCAPRTLRVATLAVPPFGMLDHGVYKGAYIDIMDAISLDTGLHFDHTLAPRARSIALVASGEADLTAGFDNAQLRQQARHVVSIAELEVVVVGRAGVRFGSLAELRGKTVGQIRSAEYDAAFNADQSIRKFETATLQQALGMLLEGRLDAVIGVRPSIQYTMRKEGMARQRFGEMLHVHHLPVWLHYSAKTYDAAIAETLRAAVVRLRENGTTERIIRRYMEGS